MNLRNHLRQVSLEALAKLEFRMRKKIALADRAACPNCGTLLEEITRGVFWCDRCRKTGPL